MSNNPHSSKVNIVEFTRSEISRLSGFYNGYQSELVILKMLKASKDEQRILLKKIADICDQIEEHREVLQVLTGGHRL